MLKQSCTLNVVYSHDDTQKIAYRNPGLLSNELNLVILIPFLQNFCTKTLMFSSLQSPTSSTLHWLLVLYHQTSKLLLSNPCSKKKTPSIKMYWKTTVQSPTCHFCLKFLKRPFHTNVLHTSKKTTSAVLSSQPTAPDTAPRPHSYAL